MSYRIKIWEANHLILNGLRVVETIVKVNQEDLLKKDTEVTQARDPDSEEDLVPTGDHPEIDTEGDLPPALSPETEEKAADVDTPTPEKEDRRIVRDPGPEINDQEDPAPETEDLEDPEIGDPEDPAPEIEDPAGQTPEIREVENPRTEKLRTQRDPNPKIKRKLIKRREKIHQHTLMMREIKRKMRRQNRMIIVDPVKLKRRGRRAKKSSRKTPVKGRTVAFLTSELTINKYQPGSLASAT